MDFFQNQQKLKSINAAHRNTIEIYVMLFSFDYELSWQLPVYCYNFVYKLVWLPA